MTIRESQSNASRAEWIAERAAIRQFDGELDEWEAARLAVLDWDRSERGERDANR